MTMTGFEKWLINRPKRGQRAVDRTEELFHYVGVKEGQNFLEVGCGNGAVSKHVARNYHLNVTGIDIDPEQVQLAQRDIDDISGIRFLACDGTNLPFQDGEFDIVLSFVTLHHISDWLGALAEIKRVLKVKGYFVYYDFVFTEFIAKLGRSFRHGYGMTTMHELNSFIQENGWSTVYASKTNSLVWCNWNAVYQNS